MRMRKFIQSSVNNKSRLILQRHGQKAVASRDLSQELPLCVSIADARIKRGQVNIVLEGRAKLEAKKISFNFR